MSRLVMLPNARRVPEFPPVSPVGKPGAGLAAYKECQCRSSLRAKSPEADYLGAVRGIIAGAWLVVPKQLTGCGSGHWPGGGPGRYARGTDLSVPSEGGIRLERGSRGSGSGCLTYAPCMAELEEIGQVDRGAQDVAAIELSS
jgi:hypothetical protein